VFDLYRRVERLGSMKLWQPAAKSKVPIPYFRKILKDYKLKDLVSC
jgi:hypothetical protein